LPQNVTIQPIVQWAGSLYHPFVVSHMQQQDLSCI